MFASLGIALATSINAKPASGPRDNGNDVQTPITVTGDLTDTPTTDFSNLGAYWDLPTSTPNSSYLMTDNGWSIQSSTGVFNIPTEVPLYDGNTNPGSAGAHKITVCAVAFPSTNGFPICLTTNFTVLRGIASLSPSSGRPGDAISVNGSRWVPGNGDEEIRLTWAPAGSAIPLTNFFFPGSSTWSTTFNVPNAAPGTYQVRICNVSNSTGNCVAQDTILKPFTIVPPLVTLKPASGLTGVSFNINGSRFRPGRPLKLYFGPPGNPKLHDITPANATTNASGAFGPYPYAPGDPPGSYVVTACTIPHRLRSKRYGHRQLHHQRARDSLTHTVADSNAETHRIAHAHANTHSNGDPVRWPNAQSEPDGDRVRVGRRLDIAEPKRQPDAEHIADA